MALATWFIIALLIAVNALYVAAEFAAVAVRRTVLRQRAEEGNSQAQRLLPHLEEPHRLDRYIAACQIGITISSLVLGAFGQARLAPALAPVFERYGDMQAVAAHSTAAVIVLLGLTLLQMVLGELVPKSLALQYPAPIALYTFLPMRWSLRLLSWFIVVLNGSGWLVLRALGLDPGVHRHLHSPEEIEYLIAESRQGGALKPAEHERLKRALQLGALRVEAIMVPRVHIRGVDVHTPFERLVAIAAESPYTRLVTYDDSLDRVLGHIHVQDVVRRSLEGRPVPARELVRGIPVVPEGMTADRVLVRLREERKHMALVLDEFGGTAGLVTVGDVLDAIFGSVGDEFATAHARPERLADGRVRLPGGLRVDVAAEWVGAPWRGDAVTVGGLVTEALGRLPAEGERVVVDGVPLEVERMRGRAVDTVIAMPRTVEVEDDLE